jgi:hypothetical protein
MALLRHLAWFVEDSSHFMGELVSTAFSYMETTCEADLGQRSCLIPLRTQVVFIRTSKTL